MIDKLKIDSIKNIVELDGVEKHFGEIAALDGSECSNSGR
jgi:hypothetical protein